jgi:3-hydroxyacyl-[acyl-carrier-protein] dehydratase
VSDELVPGVGLREERRLAAGELTGELEVAETHPGFEGHFPGRPVLPAVAQVQIVVALCDRLLQRGVHVAEIARMKLVRPVSPGARLTFRLGVDEQRVSWTLREGGELVSSGVMGIE